MILKNEFTGETIKVDTAEEAYDAFCELSVEDCSVQYDYESDLEDLANEVVNADEDYHKAQDFYVLITEAKNEQIILADKLDQIAKLQKQEMDSKFAKLQEISKEFNELYELSEEENDVVDEEDDCDYDCENCGYEECPEREKEQKVEFTSPYNSASSSYKVGDNFFEVEAHWNAPVSKDAWLYVMNKLADQI